MKKRLLKAGALAVLGWTVVLAAVERDELAKSHVKAMQDDGSITNVVNMIISDGTVCRIRGHDWRDGCGYSGCLVIHPGPMRHCGICGAVQAREVGPWR